MTATIRANESLPELTLRALRQFVGPAALTTGALYYFGWVRTRAVARYFGMDPEILGYSTSDYVLRSVSTVFPLVVVTAGVLYSANLLFRRSLRTMETTMEVRAFGGQIATVGAALTAVGFVLLAFFQQLLAASALLAAIGPLVALPGLGMMVVGDRLRRASLVNHTGELVVTTPVARHRAVPLGMLGVASVFATVFLVADFIGTQTAANRARGLVDEPRVILTSQSELHLFGTQLGEVLRDNGALSQPWTRQYRDLRLWAEANGRWILVPPNWSDNKVVHVVAIDGTVRLDIDER